MCDGNELQENLNDKSRKMIEGLHKAAIVMISQEWKKFRPEDP
jgi:hypothetical protein